MGIWILNNILDFWFLFGFCCYSSVQSFVVFMDELFWFLYSRKLWDLLIVTSAILIFPSSLLQWRVSGLQSCVLGNVLFSVNSLFFHSVFPSLFITIVFHHVYHVFFRCLCVFHFVFSDFLDCLYPYLTPKQPLLDK